MIGLFAVSVGLPFFAVATNAPLLQRWFSHSGHSAAADPYFLYGASNLGSILALLAYPVAVEPLLSLEIQGWAWAAAYAVLVGLIGACGFSLRRRYVAKAGSAGTIGANSGAPSVAPGKINWSRRLRWLVLAFVPSSLLLGVTSHVTTDVASVPLLWVIPLTLYLLTFVLVFARRPVLKHAWMVKAQPFLVILLVLFFRFLGGLPVVVFCFHMAAFFVTAMVCHGQLARRRPGADDLTEFYLWMSVGGMLGGVFNVLVAPLVFDGVYEYPLVLVLACLLRPRKSGERFADWRDAVFPAALVAILGLPAQLFGVRVVDFGVLAVFLFFMVLGLAGFSFSGRPLRFGLGVAAILATTALNTSRSDVIDRERSFFGVLTVKSTMDGNFMLMVHGNTLHGTQHRDPARWREPVSYYSRNGPLGQIFAALDGVKNPARVGVIGLGTGSAACYQRPGQRWTFYEIDPTVTRLAADTRYFHYMSECAGEDTEVVHGDGRLALVRAPDALYDLIILDAFSSDAIPIHLLTREALGLYLAKLADGGGVIAHISNRNLVLSGIVANLAVDAGLVGRQQRHITTPQQKSENAILSSHWVVLARASADLSMLAGDARWRPLEPDSGAGLWTDDFSNILTALRWRLSASPSRPGEDGDPATRNTR